MCRHTARFLVAQPLSVLVFRLGRKGVVSPLAPIVVVASPVRGTTLRRVVDQHWRADQRGHPACVCDAMLPLKFAFAKFKRNL
jgi:hypothetical protein